MTDTYEDNINNTLLNTLNKNNTIFPSPTYILGNEINGDLDLDLQSEEKRKISIKDPHSLSFINEKKIFNNNIHKEENTTVCKTNPKNNFGNDNDFLITEIQKNSSGLYSFEDIKKLLSNNNNDNSFVKILENFKKDSIIEQAEEDLKLIQRKRKRNLKKNEDNNNNIGIKYKRGRKLKNDISERNHNKAKDDNIVVKIKIKIFQEVLNNLNNILNENNEDNNNKKLKDLEHKLIRQMKRDTNIKLLDMPLKEVFSKKISSKFKTFDEKSNELYIQKIMNEEKRDEIIMFFFNLKLKEWIDLFTMKNNIENIKSLSLKSRTEIKKKLPRVDFMLNEILKKNNEKYLSYFIFYLYNFENYFLSKQSRRSKFERINKFKNVI